MRLLDYPPKRSLQLFARHASDICGHSERDIYERCLLAVKAYRNNDEGISHDICDGLERWYSALDKGEVDYSVYDGIGYLPEGWACWVEYSRSYLRNIQDRKSLFTKSIVEDLGALPSIIDLGCGFGYTTVALRQMLPKAKVLGTNFPESIQYRMADDLAKKCGFEMASDIDGFEEPVGMVFASEFFEHIQEPLAYLRKVLGKKPKALIVANAFGTRAIGHFRDYHVDGDVCDGKETAKRFSDEMKLHGYSKRKTRLWNNRPSYWRLDYGRKK